MSCEKYVFALAGNPNCGKTTLFNSLTGSRLRVGNRAGVTVEIKKGDCKYGNIKIVDLPGIYSLSPISSEETISRDYIEKGEYDLIINIADATNLNRSLYFTTMLIETGRPVILALNMSDALKKNGIEIDTSLLSKSLGIPVVPISAAKNTGIPKLIATSLKHTRSKNKNILPHISTPKERYKFINTIIAQCTRVTGENKQYRFTERIDSILMHPILAIPLFLLIMLAIFQITFGTLGSALSAFTENIFTLHLSEAVRTLLENIGAGTFVKGLICDGVITGIASIAAFFPQIILLFFFLSLLEDTGYMARTAFIMDRLFVKLGLSGKAFIPMILGFGCSVPAIMSARALENKRCSALTILLIPFMSCGAKLPVYALFASSMFPHHAGLVIFSLYVIGAAMALLSGVILSKTLFRGTSEPLFLELPPYRMPKLKNIFRQIAEKTRDFAIRAGSVLLFASAVIWLLENVDFTLHMTSNSQNSILCSVGKFIAPIFAPCGFGDYRAAVSLLSGFAAKEAILSSLSVLLSAGKIPLSASLGQVFTTLSAYSFLVFVLLYVPCMAALAVMRRELNSAKLTVFSAVWQLLAAWLVSMLIFQIGSLFI